MKIIHHTDNDGNLSASIIKKKYPEAICIPYNYEGLFPLNKIKKNEKVFIVDISIKTRNLLSKILEKSKNFVWIDHHHTSTKVDDKSIEGIRVDGRPSACVLCWEYIFQDRPVPELVQIVNDYDTWAHFFGEKTKFFNIAMSLCDTPESLLDKFESKQFIQQKVREGKTIFNYINHCYKQMSKRVFLGTILDHTVLVCNSYGYNSYVFDFVKEKAEIKAVYFFDGENFHVSLYSETVDCSEIAEQFGGGGHKAAAGFRSQKFPFVLSEIKES
jgi:uncharacterized protein